MAQLSDDCFAFGGELMPLATALEILRAKVSPQVAVERVPLAAARGRILAAALVAPFDVPPAANSAVDGYAVRHADLRPGETTELRVGGRAAAGHPLSHPARPGEAIRIFTGAPMPEGLDTVLMQEDCREEGGVVAVPPGIKRGANRRLAGEDVTAGSTALAAGCRLRAQEIGLAASLGATELAVFRRLAVALLSTGDELAEPGARLAAGAIYDSNRYTLGALLEGLGAVVSDLGILPDRPEALRDQLRAAAMDHDLIVTSGGMSTGEEDHVKAAVGAEGALHFWRLAIKPGRPVAMGHIAGVPFIGLPGNPVAVMVTFLLLGRPLVLGLSGAADIAPRRYPVRAAFDYKKKANRSEYVRVRLSPGADGGWLAERFPKDGAGILSSMVWADGLAEIGEGVTRLEPGSIVEFLPFSEVIP